MMEVTNSIRAKRFRVLSAPCAEAALSLCNCRTATSHDFPQSKLAASGAYHS